MSNNDFLHQILSLRKRCLAKIEEEDNSELVHLHEQLTKWQQQIINELEKFIQNKFHEIKQKYLELYQQQLRHLDILYSNCLSNHLDSNNKQSYSQLIEDYNNSHSPVEIVHPKQIDFNSYVQFNTNRLNDIQRSLTLMNKRNHLNLGNYQLFSTLSIQTNLTSLFATHDRLLVYYDHYASAASLNIFDLKNYLEQSTNDRSCLKLRVPCKQFQGKVMHMEYCAYLQGFLLATGSKLFILQLPNTLTNYHVTEYFDIGHRNFPGILQKFACHPTKPNFIYLLVNTLSDHTLIQLDLTKTVHIRKKWTYPRDDNHFPLTTTDNRMIKSHLQLTSINDFALGKDTLIFAVTYQSNDCFSYQFHIRSSDMHLQHHFTLNSSLCPLRICMIPCDYATSWNEQEQFLVIYQNSKILSLYELNPLSEHREKLQLTEETILDTEPEYLGFANNDLSVLLLRNLFHIAIYKQMNNNNHPNLLLRTSQRSSCLLHHKK